MAQGIYRNPNSGKFDQYKDELFIVIDGKVYTLYSHHYRGSAVREIEPGSKIH